MLAYYGDRISPNMTVTPEGFLICHDVPIARTGDMTYRASELQLDGDPDRPVTVHRYPEDVFSDEAVASFEGKDVTAGHPAGNVGAENYSAYSRGHVQNVRRSGEQLVADLLIKDAALISDIRNNVVREVSCGYLCQYVPDGDGYRQKEIRGNHVAVVPRGRAGRAVSIKDDAAGAAEKGRKQMKDFWKSVLTAFGMAAKEASPEELGAMVDTTMTALDAAPAGKPPEAEPSPPDSPAPAEDAAPDALEAKLDRLIALLEPKQRESSGGEALDQLITDLEKQSGDAAPVSPGGDEPAPLTGPARDAAMAILKSVRPAVVSIEDSAVRARVADALVDAVREPDALEAIVQAAQKNAKRAADAAGKTSYEQICAAQQSAYDARNPHKKKED